MKHAFLICAHNNFQLLERLIRRLDDKDFDSYVHIDAKVGDIDYKYYESIAKKSRVFFLQKRIKVIWGDVSQIKVTFLLIEEALKQGDYDYLHFISGVDYPIKSNGYIKDFFSKNSGKEFVGFTPWTPVLDNKIGYYHFFNVDQLKQNNIINWLNSKIIRIQELLNIRHYKDTHVFSKGCNWWSITTYLAENLVKEKYSILSKYRYTLCADEIFLQTFVMENVLFSQKLYDVNDEYRGCLRLVDWERGNPYVWKKEDINTLLSSPALFARKFSETFIEVIDVIDKNIC